MEGLDAEAESLRILKEKIAKLNEDLKIKPEVNIHDFIVELLKDSKTK